MAVTPKSYAKIIEITQSIEVVNARKIQKKSTRKNYKAATTPSPDTAIKRKETLAVATPMD